MSWLSDWLNWLSQPRIKHTLYGALIGISISYTRSSLTRYLNLRKRRRQVEAFEARPIELRSDEIVPGVTGLIGMYMTNSTAHWNMTLEKGTPLWLG